MMGRRILIIKTGRHETFQAHDKGHHISLGDIVRTTPLLRAFQDDEVSWLVSPDGVDLLQGLNNLKLFVNTSAINFQDFDLIINFEREPEILFCVQKVDETKVIGFILNDNGEIFFRTSQGKASLSTWLRSSTTSKNWTERLFQCCGLRWSGETAVLPQPPRSEQLADVGLNWRVGQKWPEKAWPEANWQELNSALGHHSYRVSWQKGFTNLKEYMYWISSCECLITHDSLGLHLAMAMNKKVILLGQKSFLNDIDLLVPGAKLSIGFDEAFLPYKILEETQKLIQKS